MPAMRDLTASPRRGRGPNIERRYSFKDVLSACFCNGIGALLRFVMRSEYRQADWVPNAPRGLAEDQCYRPFKTDVAQADVFNQALY